MIELIVGLGNPGEKYKQTRHNIGFEVLNTLAQEKQITFAYEKKYDGDVSFFFSKGQKIWLLKPQTFMNLSGESVAKFCQYHNIAPENILIIYDDKDLEFKKIRFREKGSAGGHNGMKSSIQHTHTENIKRLKIGIQNNLLEKMETKDFVLGSFASEEKQEIPALIQEAMSFLENIIC